MNTYQLIKQRVLRAMLGASLAVAMPAWPEHSSVATGGDEADRHPPAAQSRDLYRAAERAAIDEMALEALDQLLVHEPGARDLLDRAHGYAVFGATKAGVLVTAAGGRGLAHDPATKQTTYMTMASAGVGLGAGLQGYRLILLFETAEAFQSFVDGKWDASVSAVAAAGQEGNNAVSSFVRGIAAFQITDRGLMAQVDIAGTRFWPNRKLNRDS